MYEGHFGLTKNPFSMTPDAKALFLTPAHREALAGLSYAVLRRKGFAVLIGEAGTGKTTLIQSLVGMAGELKAQFSVVLNPTLSSSEFLELLLHNFGMRDLPASKAQRLIRLEQLLQDSKKAGRCPVLIVDEAHRLKFEVLEEIRLLTKLRDQRSEIAADRHGRPAGVERRAEAAGVVAVEAADCDPPEYRGALGGTGEAVHGAPLDASRESVEFSVYERGDCGDNAVFAENPPPDQFDLR